MSDTSEVDIDSMDLLNYSSQSQSFDYGDCDTMLEHLSSSQQEREDELDRMDEQIRLEMEEEKERLKAKEEHEKIVHQHRSKPALIRVRPPGLRVFIQDHPPSFTFSDLSLVDHFGWAGKSRLKGDRLTPDNMKKMVEGEDMFYMVRYLTPELTNNVMITNSEDFNSVVNFILFKAVLCKDKLLYQVLKKCLFDLLQSYYHYEWVLSPDQFLTLLLNLGADPQLVNNQNFYDSAEFCKKPELLYFNDSKDIQTKRSFQPGDRLLFLSQLLQITSQVFALPAREEDYERVDHRVWKTFVFLISVVGQEESLINRPTVSQDISTLLGRFLWRLNTQDDIQDLAELLTSLFLPQNLLTMSGDCGSSWVLPDHFLSRGLNHPHNMLHLTHLIPGHANQLKQLVCFMNIQLILNNSVPDLPSECHVEDVLKILGNGDNLLGKNWSQLDTSGQYYCCWTLLHLMDILVQLDGENYQTGSLRNKSLRDMSSFIERSHVKGKIKDSLDVDNDKVTMLASDLMTRWKNILNKADNKNRLLQMAL